MKKILLLAALFICTISCTRTLELPHSVQLEGLLFAEDVIKAYEYKTDMQISLDDVGRQITSIIETKRKEEIEALNSERQLAELFGIGLFYELGNDNSPGKINKKYNEQLSVIDSIMEEIVKNNMPSTVEDISNNIDEYNRKSYYSRDRYSINGYKDILNECLNVYIDDTDVLTDKLKELFNYIEILNAIKAPEYVEEGINLNSDNFNPQIDTDKDVTTYRNTIRYSGFNVNLEYAWNKTNNDWDISAAVTSPAVRYTTIANSRWRVEWHTINNML